MRRLILLVLLAFVVTAASTRAMAADNKAESDKLFAEGLALFAKKDFVTARQKFAEAYAKYPSPNSLLNLARSEQLSDHCVDAIAHYRAYIALPENPRVSVRDRDSARTKLGECVAKVGRIRVDAPSSARVSIDGNAVIWTPGEPIDVEPGVHRVDLAVATDSKTRSVNATAGEVATATWEDPKPPEPPPPPPQEVKPPEPPPPPPQAVAPEPPPPPAPTPTPTPPPPAATWKKESHWPAIKVVGAIGLGVLSVTSFIMAPAFLAASEANARDADALATKLGPTGCSGANPPADCATLTAKRTSQNQLNTAATTFFVLGPLFALGAVVVMLLVPNVHPLVTATGDGFAVHF